MKRPNLILSDREAALITECEGNVFVIEMMRILWPSEARAIARAHRAGRASPRAGLGHSATITIAKKVAR